MRQRESYGQMHILPVFAKLVTHALDVRALQQFSTSLQNNLSPKTVVNILEIDLMPLRRTTWHENGLQSGLKDTGAAVFAVLRYAKKSGMSASSVSFSDLTLRAAETPELPHFSLPRNQSPEDSHPRHHSGSEP